ncbi:MAG TPA: alpha/beta fold hydrolase [Syntrophomonadaceae bacterium]|nr:alpha/beta fold hydrolase [Syntrophomonadaceae bacterium]
MSAIAPQAQPFLWPGTGHAALLFVHGFTASPSEVAPTARLIHQSGNITVQGILLPGHGTDPLDLNQTRWLDWYRVVEDRCHHLLGEYDQVYLAGLSMGGMLALYAGLHVEGLKGIISINAPLFVRNPGRVRVAPLLQFCRSCWPKEKVEFDSREQERFAYDCYPLKALSSMLILRRRLMKGLPDMKLPLLIMQSKQDESVLMESAHYIFRHCRQAEVRVLELPRSKHVATMGVEKEMIAQEIQSFINTNS